MSSGRVQFVVDACLFSLVGRAPLSKREVVGSNPTGGFSVPFHIRVKRVKMI